MNAPQMDERFSAAFREALVDRVKSSNPHPKRRAAIGVGASLAILLGGTVAAAASGLITLPGGTEIEHLGATRSETFVGTGTLELGSRPQAATGVALSFTCLSLGKFSFSDGASVTCASATDIGQPATYVLPLASMARESLTVVAESNSVWTVTAGYVASKTTDWAVNESGETYGVLNERGQPDLIAVIATNGKQGYVHRSELEAADGTTASKSFNDPQDALRWQERNVGEARQVSVYKQDGTTLIGIFLVE